MQACWSEARSAWLVRPILAFLGLGVLVLLGVASVTVPSAPGAIGPPDLADANSPTGEIEYPLADAWVTYSYVGLRVRFTDVDGIMESSLSMEIDGLPLSTNWHYYTEPTDIVLSSASMIAEGPHVAEARASDRLGNGPTVLSWSFSVDTIRPVLNMTYPVGNPVLESGSITLAWTGNDAGSGIDHYWVRLDDGPYVNVGKETTFPFHALAPGIHYFRVSAVDVAGNSNLYWADVIAVATVSAPPPLGPPANATSQVTVIVPDQMPAWGVALVVINAAEAAAIVGFAFGRRRGSFGGGAPGP